jgi:hypothetical protein
MDADCIVRAIHNKIYPWSQWGQIARVCARILENNNQVTLSWVLREDNKVVHSLARWAKIEPNKYWTSNFPVCIVAHIQNDRANVT